MVKEWEGVSWGVLRESRPVTEHSGGTGGVGP